MTRPEIEPRSSGPLANTLTIMPMSGTQVIYAPKTSTYYQNIAKRLTQPTIIDKDVVGKALGNPDGVWGPEKLLIRCSKEIQHPAEWTPGPPVEHQENEKDTTLTAIRVGGQDITVMFGLQLPLTWKSCNKVRGTYFSKEVFLRLSLLLCRYDTAHENITHGLKSCFEEYELFRRKKTLALVCLFMSNIVFLYEYCISV